MIFWDLRQQLKILVIFKFFITFVLIRANMIKKRSFEEVFHLSYIWSNEIHFLRKHRIPWKYMAPNIQYRLTDLPTIFWNLISIQNHCVSLFTLIFTWLQLLGQIQTVSLLVIFICLKSSGNHNNNFSHSSILAILSCFENFSCKSVFD